MHVRVGAVCTSGPGVVGARGHGADAYVVGQDGRVSWLQEGQERHERTGAAGVLLAAIEGDAGRASHQLAAGAAAQVITRLYTARTPRDPLRVLTAWLADAHTRLYWEARARSDRTLGASAAVCWLLDDTAWWAQLGTARVLLSRDGEVRPLAASWPEGDAQRLIAGSRGLGDDTAVHLRPGLNVGGTPLRAQDALLVCTDGCWRTVDLASTAHLLRHTDDPQAAAVSCMERALARGAVDDVTVLLARVDAVGAPQARPEPPPAPQTAPPARSRSTVP